MIRKYGEEPLKVALIHGGPGACGSLACVAKELSKSFGAAEMIQSKYSVPELINELHEQVSEVAKQPITLIGHSWGAWLTILFAAQYPDLIKKIILVGCCPLKKEYVPWILERRLKNLSEDEADLFRNLLLQLESQTAKDKDAILSKLGELTEKSDQYDPTEIEDVTVADGQMYSSVWPQADQMRSNGTLADALRQIKCPVIVIHGENDPHPVEGVVGPIKEQGYNPEVYVLSKSGHSPFKEKNTIDQFYKILRHVIVR